LPQALDFVRDVRPILAKHCFECHGPETQESGLRLDERGSAIKRAKSGRLAIVPGKSTASRLLQVITGRDAKLSMPPDGPRLAAGEIDTLRRWIDQGARWDRAPDSPAAPRIVETSDKLPGADFWSFQPVRAVHVPTDRRFESANPIDAFIAEKLQSAGLNPSPPADRRSLIRRLYLDVLGLPPTPADIADFSADADPLAWSRLIDRVLASPHYGERWARHWLDVVRFAETDGFETNVERPNAFRYRDFVIGAFNDDKPYDRFVFEQLAGDSVGEDSATGFLVGGPCDKVKSPDVVLTRMQRQDELSDMINTTGTAFLGLTLGCAKCHNHKFDPIPQHDFYAIQAVFAGVTHSDRVVRDSEGRKQALVPSKANRVSKKGGTGSLLPVKLALAAENTGGQAASATQTTRSPASQQATHRQVAMAYAGRFEEPGPVHRLFRGDPMSPRELVEPGGIAVLGRLEIPETAPEQRRRVALAAWIARAQNPLTARVIVNRLWHYHFGRGIVETPSDFGHNGGRPSHPELLDWLAGELIQSGWSLKHVHRLILTSNTYRQSSAPRADGLKADAGARLLWRFPPKRLEAEAIRDSMLAASGVLDERMGGPGFSAFEPNNNYVRVYRPKEQFGPTEWRRMVYMLKVRMEQDSVFGAFDCPDAGLIAPRRTQSTTALQALNLFNSRFAIQQAELLALRTEREVGPRADRQVGRAFELTLGRPPDDVEAAAARRLLVEHGQPALCRALFNANEFLFVP